MSELLPTIAPATEEEVRSGALGQQLREFNYRFVGEYPLAEPVRFNARDDGGKLLGGVRGFVFLHWLRVEVLWVADAARGMGLGTRLMAQAEEQSRQHGAIGAVLETFTWQAPDFYRKLGYEECGRVERFVGTYDLLTMSKRWG